VTAAIYVQSPPTSIYILNTSNECSNCGNMNAFTSALSKDLANYTILNGTNHLTTLQLTAASVEGIKSDSILIVPNGYLPDFMLSGASGATPLDVLLGKGTTIIYIGQNFSRLITGQSILVPVFNLPAYLATYIPTQAPSQTSYYFTHTTFAFSGGDIYGPLSYVNVGNGHIVAFSNYLSSWPTPQDAASDVAATIFQGFWLSRFTSGTVSMNLAAPYSRSGSIGVLLNSTHYVYSPLLPSVYATGFGRVAIVASNNLFTSPTGTSYKIIYFQPKYSLNGTLDLPNVTSPGQPITSEMQINVKAQTQVEPHIDLYDRNLSYIESLPPLFSKTVSGSYTFYGTFSFSLPAGVYIAQLNGFSGQHYASAYFSVPGVIFSLLGINFSQGTFTFSATAGGVPVTNEAANITVNGQYPETVYINNGRIVYTMPIGVSPPSGNLTFVINAFKQQFIYKTTYAPPVITINKQYIEFLIAIIIVILEITLVKAPTRDEFYVDVPNMPEPQKMRIKIKANELLAAFEKINLYYHWRYMPLSTSEFRFAVANTIRYENIPVTLTYSNVDILLDGLASKDYIVSADGLYAPKLWVEQSKHDIEYLAIFKKMRVYLVSHAHIFTDLDKSDAADIVTTLHNDKAFIVIYSKTSRFINNVPVQPQIKTYLVFLNADRLEEFKNGLYITSSNYVEVLKMYISTGNVVLIDADNPEGILS
jgi:hypothetical protein